MENMTTLRVDLGINAQKIAQQVMINNRHIEEQIACGIQKAPRARPFDTFFNLIATHRSSHVEN